jgi:hypothetical protein
MDGAQNVKTQNGIQNLKTRSKVRIENFGD